MALTMRVVTATGTDGMNSEANLTFDGSILGVGGRIDITGEISSPSAPADGAGGILYVKSDGKPYWISNELARN